MGLRVAVGEIACIIGQLWHRRAVPRRTSGSKTDPCLSLVGPEFALNPDSETERERSREPGPFAAANGIAE